MNRLVNRRKTMKTPTFRATCEGCEHNVITPQLPEMSYGTFLYYATDGQIVKYYEAIDDPIWQKVESIIQETKPEVTDADQGDIIRSIIGLLADAPDEEIHFTTAIICPHCRARIQTMDTSQKMGTEQLQPLPFNHFKSLTKTQQNGKIYSIVNNLQAE